MNDGDSDLVREVARLRARLQQAGINPDERPQKLPARIRRHEVLELYEAGGFSYRTLAAQFGVSLAQIAKDVRQAIDERISWDLQDKERHRNYVASSLRRIVGHAMPAVIRGDAGAIRTVRQCFDSYARLYGLNGPIMVQFSDNLIEEGMRLYGLSREEATAMAAQAVAEVESEKGRASRLRRVK